MKNEDFGKKSLVEQIHEELFDNILKHDEFDEETVKTIKLLALKGELKKYAKVIENLKGVVPKKDEIS